MMLALLLVAAPLAPQSWPSQHTPFPHCAASGCVAFAPFDDVTSALTGTIARAKKSVHVAVFNISSPVVTDALIERAKAGVDVEVMIDFQRPENAAMTRLLAEPGVRFIRVPSLRGGGPQMHHKLILVDDEEVVAGTGNFTEAALSSSVETFLETRDAGVVAAVRGEMDAMRARAVAACSVFGRRSPTCPAGRVVWDAPFEAYAKTGKFRPQDVNIGPHCASFVAGKEKLEVWPDDRSRSDVATCLRDPRFAELVQKLAPPPPPSLWSRVRGLVVAEAPPARAPVRWVSSRTTDVEEMLLAALARPHATPPVVSVSRLHQKNLVEALAREHAVVTVGSFLYGDAAGTAAGELVLAKLPDALIAHDGFLTKGSLFHDKTALIDGRVFLSSANWSAQAFTRNDESFFVVDDVGLVALFRENLARARALASPGVTEAAGLVPFDATPVSVIRVAVPDGAEPAGEIHVAGRTVPLRWDGAHPAVLVGAVDVAGDADVIVQGRRTTVSLHPAEVVSIVDVSLPSP